MAIPRRVFIEVLRSFGSGAKGGDEKQRERGKR
jgi:hypothetical protein